MKAIKRRLRFCGIIVGITVFLLAAVYISSDIVISALPAKHIVFEGNKNLTDDELKKIARIRLNESLVKISNRKICQRLLESPWVRKVSVRKEFPDTLTVIIEEAVPFAFLYMDGHLSLIDEKGRFLEGLKDNSMHLPIIRSKKGSCLSDALELVMLLKEMGFSSEKNQIEIIVSKPHNLTMIVDGTVVKVGSGEYREKLNKLIELEDEIKKVAVSYIDLRFKDRVIVKPVTKAKTLN